MTRPVLVSGMFRSGTTLLSRMLGAGGRALVVADPFVYFFKAYRLHWARELGLAEFDPQQPTSDLFFPEHPELERAILAGDLSERPSAATLDWMRGQIVAWKAEQHPELCVRLDEVRGATFADVYRSLIDLAVDTYGAPAVELAGTKVSWCEEFLPALARAFPDLRVVLLVRDVRAIAASQNSQRGRGAGKRPLLFYARHWRKSVALSEALATGVLADRAHCLRYEDLARDPRAELEALCAFLELPFDPAMVTVETFRAEREHGDWRTNSSFAQPGEGIYTASIERWRDVLSTDEIAALEAFCGPELERAGYAVEDPDREPLACLATACEPRPEELSGWLADMDCAAYVRSERQRAAEYALESLRRALLAGRVACDPELSAQLFPERLLAPASAVRAAG